jgi:hypothetical protein
MNWSDLESTWKRQQPPVPVVGDLNTLEKTFGTKSRKLARVLFWRDLREGIAGLAVIGFTARVLWHNGKLNWPLAVADLLVLAVTTFFFRERIRARRIRLGPDSPLLAKLDADIDELHRQRRLLLNVAIWYVAPLMTAWAIVMTSRFINEPALLEGWRHRLFWGSYVVGSIFLLGPGIWALNRRAVRKQIEPMIAGLERLRADLLSMK